MVSQKICMLAEFENKGFVWNELYNEQHWQDQVCVCMCLCLKFKLW
jgi:hypothetical protein